MSRVGAVRDVTEEAELKAKEGELSKKVEELTLDVGNVLHAYSTTLVLLRQSAKVVLQSLGPDPFDEAKGRLVENMVDFLEAPTRQFAESLGKLVHAAEAQESSGALPVDKKNELTKHLNLLSNYEVAIPYPMARLSTLREITVAVLAICKDVQRSKLPRELFREIRKDGFDLIRLCNLITLHQMSDMTLEMDHVVCQLRGHVLSGRREKQPRANRLVKDLVSQATSALYELARSRGIDFRVAHDDADCQVEVAQIDVVRALSNLLHNAIKYSWNRPAGAASWISIRTRLGQESIHISFENYGVPIPEEEIQQRLLFRTGFRGRKSSDRRRTGTGIGLADALEVAREHGGDVIVASRPVSPKGKHDNYDQPFLTTVDFVLPLKPMRGTKDEEAGSMD